jgi:site-specific recombinase XerD
VKAFKDRHGKARYYYRRRGWPSIALPGEPGSKAFAEAYEAAQGQKRKLGEERTVPGTFNALIVAYYESADYERLAEISKKTNRNVLERFRKNFGAMPVKSLTPKRLDELLDGTPKNRVGLRKVLRIILKLAVRREIIKVNPMDGLRLPRKAEKGFYPWTEDDIALFEKRWPTGTRERLALALLLYTAQRREDVVIMGRQHVRDGKIRVKQRKTGAELWIPVHRDLKRELDAIQKTQLNFMETQYGRTFSPAGFTNWFRERAREAGCPAGFSPHGGRKASLRRLAEAGCTPHQIMAVSGHQNLSEVTLYTAAADQERLASEAMQKAEKRTKASNHKRPVRQFGRKT